MSLSIAFFGQQTILAGFICPAYDLAGVYNNRTHMNDWDQAISVNPNWLLSHGVLETFRDHWNNSCSVRNNSLDSGVRDLNSAANLDISKINMATFESCVQAASETNHQKAPWMDNPYQPPTNRDEIIQKAIDVFLQSQRPNGTVNGIDWWQAGNAYTAITLAELYSGNGRYREMLAQTLRKCDVRRQGFINEFTDDSLWWALCCIHMYSVSGGTDEWYLEKAKAIWRHVRDSKCVVGRGEIRFHEMDMEGGVWWKTVKEGNQISAISSGLYAECAMRLALIERKRSQGGSRPGEPTVEEYVEAARFSLGWILRTRYRPRQGVVLGGINLELDKARDWTFTYTTGVTFAICALLYEITREEEYMTLAIHMAWRSMRRDGWVEPNGVLTEKGAYGPDKNDPAKNNNAVGFKSVLIRQLATLYEVIQRTEYQTPKATRMLRMIRQFVNINFESQQERNTNGQGQYGPWWNGPYVMSTTHSQMAVLDVMAAVILVNR